MILLLLSAHAADMPTWLKSVDAKIDSALPTLQSCVSFTKAVSADHPELVHFELGYDARQGARVTVKDTSFEPRTVATCIAGKLGSLVWPEPPHRPGAAGFTVALTDVARRTGAAFAAPPLPGGLAGEAALGRDAFRLRADKLKLGARCLQPRVVGEAEDISARFDVTAQLQADGSLKLSEITGGGEDTTLRSCLVEELERARFPAGYPATPPVPIVVEMSAKRTGAALSGPFAGWQADGG